MNALSFRFTYCQSDEHCGILHLLFRLHVFYRHRRCAGLRDAVNGSNLWVTVRVCSVCSVCIRHRALEGSRAAADGIMGYRAPVGIHVRLL